MSVLDGTVPPCDLTLVSSFRTALLQFQKQARPPFFF